MFQSFIHDLLPSSYQCQLFHHNSEPLVTICNQLAIIVSLWHFIKFFCKHDYGWSEWRVLYLWRPLNIPLWVSHGHILQSHPVNFYCIMNDKMTALVNHERNVFLEVRKTTFLNNRRSITIFERCASIMPYISYWLIAVVKMV